MKSKFNQPPPIIAIIAPVVIAIFALIISVGGIFARPEYGVTNFGSVHLRDTNPTQIPNFVADQRGVGVIAEWRDGGTPVARMPNGGGFNILSGSLTSDGVLNIADTDSTLTGAQTITPTYSYLQVSPTALLTATLATGSATDGDLLVIHNLVTTNTVIVDTGATQGGGNITLGQDDIAVFIFGDSVWVEIASPDNS